MRTAKRIDNLPPYLFAEIDRKKAIKTAQGIDVISLGIGDPDTPTPDHIVEAMIEATKNPANHQYPSYVGAPRYRAACAEWMKRRFDVEVDPATEVLAMIGSKEGIAHLFTRVRRSRRVHPRSGRGLPRVPHRRHHGRRRDVVDAHDRGERLPRRLRVHAGRGARQGQDDVPELPQQPHLGNRQRRVLRPRDRVRQGQRPAHRPRQRLLGDRLRRLRRTELPQRPGAKDVAIELFSARRRTT